MLFLPSIGQWLPLHLSGFLPTRISFQILPSNTTTRAGAGQAAQQVPCFGLARLEGGGLFNMASMDYKCGCQLYHFHELYLGTDKCGPIHVDEKTQPEPERRCLGKGFLLQFQTTHTCTVNECSRGYWSTTFMRRPKALLSSALFSPPPPPAFPRTIRWHGNFREKLGDCLFGMPAHTTKERNLEVF